MWSWFRATMLPCWSASRFSGSNCTCQILKRSQPTAISVTKSSFVASSAVVATPAVGVVNDCLMLCRPVLVNPIIRHGALEEIISSPSTVRRRSQPASERLFYTLASIIENIRGLKGRYNQRQMDLNVTIQALRTEVAKLDRAIVLLKEYTSEFQRKTRRGRKFMSVTKRREVSERKRRYWAVKRRAAATAS